MADYDVADLLARCRRELQRPTTDLAFTDPDFYAWLTEAEAHWLPILALHAPGHMLTAPTQLNTTDNIVFSFPGLTEAPLAVSITESLTGEPLVRGAFWDPDADYVWEGATIRMPGNRERSFSDGPYGRWIAPPATINVSTDSNIKPERLRILLVHHACMLGAERGGGRLSPQVYEARMNKAAWGNPLTGDVGMVGALKQHDPTGQRRMDGLYYKWWQPNSYS
jgi:hypothetical protein